MGARFFLESGEDPFKPIRWPEGERSVTIGRGKDCFLRLDEGQASRRHATITCRLGRYYLEDLNSRNGTFLDGRAVKKAALESGSRIRIGKTVIRFYEEETIGVGPDTVAFDGIGGESRQSILCLASVGLGVLGLFMWPLAVAALAAGAFGSMNARLRPRLGGMWLGVLGAALGGGGFLYHSVTGGVVPLWYTWGGARMRIECRRRLSEVRDGLRRYRSDHGRAPESLDALVPHYLSDPGMLYCPAAEARSGTRSDEAAYSYDPQAARSRRSNRWVARDPSLDAHEKGGTALFSDGRVQWLERRDFAEMLRADAERAAREPPGEGAEP